MKEFFIDSELNTFSKITEEVSKKGLAPGVYTIEHDRIRGDSRLKEITMNSNRIINLPNSPFEVIVSEVTKFFTPEVKKKFLDRGNVYKKSVLLYGSPGTGKTCLVVKLTKLFRETFKNGIVLFNPDVQGLIHFYELYKEKDIPILVVFEEFDNLMKWHELDFLNILDGELQRDSTFYLFTTNYISKIPKRMLRLGRMTNQIKIDYPSKEAREYFITNSSEKLSEVDVQDLVKTTQGFSIDELQHLMLLTECLDYEMETALKIVTMHKNQYRGNDD